MTDSCSKCGEDAVIHREHEGRSLCRRHFSISVNKQVKQTIRRENLVESDDTIAVGLSGGKDSAVLLEQLVEIFGDRPDIEIVGLAIDEGIEDYRDESIEAARELCEELGVELEVARYSDEHDITMDEVVEQGVDKSNCTYCGILRRDLLNRKARELGADKLAIGHNLDDEAQAIMMNYIRGDDQRLARIGAEPGVVENEKFVPRIKPLLDIPEREVALYSRLHDLGVIDECPHVEEKSMRPMVKKFLNRLERESPGAKYSIVAEGRRLGELVEDSLDRDAELGECDRCGEPASGELCRKCELLDEITPA